MVHHEKIMNKTIQIIATCFIFLSSSSWADQALTITRYPAQETHAGKVQKIDFPPGYSIEYFYDDAGVVSKKKLTGFKELNYKTCTPGNVCEVTRADQPFYSAASFEVLMSKTKDQTIPSLLVAIERLNKSDWTKIQEDLITIWRVIVQGYVKQTISNPELMQTEYERLKGEFNTNMTAQTTFIDRTKYLLTDLYSKMETLEKNEVARKHIAGTPLREDEKNIISKHIQNIGACTPALKNILEDFLNKGSFVRQRSASEEALNELREFVTEGNITIDQLAYSTSKMSYNIDWFNQLTTEQQKYITNDLAKVLILQPTLMHVVQSTYQTVSPEINITDRVMMYYPDHLSMIMPNNSDNHRLMYFGDANVDVTTIFGKNPNHYFEWILVHEYGHILQQLYFFKVLESDKMNNLARIAIDLDAQNVEKIIRQEVKDKLKIELIDPMSQVFEQSASYFAIDNLPCF
jgi:uncharacterized coiled-coil protein SlyX